MYYGLLVVAWALQVAWIARAAQDHGRSVAFWIIVGGGLGITGLVVAKMLVSASAQPFGGNTLMYVTFVAPLGLMTIPMASVAIALTKAPTYAARRPVWKVHSAKRGSGTLAIGRDRIALEWSDSRDEIEVDQLREAVPDGECLRLAWADRELVVMPLEKPDTRPGRQAQARALAAQIAAFRRRS